MYEIDFKKRIFQNLRAFTLIEAVVTVVLVATIASLALAGYQKTIENASERQAVTDLMTMISSEKIYFVRNNQHWPALADPAQGISAIQSNLGLTSLNEPNHITYTCQTGAQGPDYQASYDSGKWVLSTYNSANQFKPFCSSGTCPTCKSIALGGCF